MNESSPTPTSEARGRLSALCAPLLAELLQHDGGLRAAVLATSDGFELAHAAKAEPADTSRVAAISSALASIGEAAVFDLDLGDMSFLVIEAEGGHVALMSLAGEPFSLSLFVTATRDVLLATLLLYMRRTANAVRAAAQTVFAN